MKQCPFLIIFLFTCLVGGCRASVTSGHPIPAFTATLLAIKASPAPITTTLEATATLMPTEIPVASASTPDVAATVIAISPPRIHSSFPSANGEWRAEVVIHDCVKIDPRGIEDPNAVERLKLIRVNDKTETIVESDLLTCGGVGEGGIGGLFWSPNDQYFYFTDARHGVPDGLCGYWARPIKRVNVDSQNLEPVGGGHLSPNKKKLALWQDHEIIIWSLDEGEIARIPAIMSDAFKNEIAWSPTVNPLYTYKLSLIVIRLEHHM